MMKHFLLFLLCLILISNAGYSQRWKKERFQVAYGLGAANFLGELGGANDVGSNFAKDLEFAATRPSTSILLRYRLTQKIALRGSFALGYVSGADSLTQEIHRHYRNLSFRSPILELSGQVEYNIIKEKDARRYRLRGARGGGAFTPNLYVFVGLGGFYFNPQAKLNGKWYNLHSYGTEGQKLGDLAPTRQPYSRLSVAIPYGLGMRFPVNRTFAIGLEFGIRKTFTDYIDDVSTTYVDNKTLENSTGGIIAAQLADRSPEINAGYTQRGDPTNKDTYMFLFVSVYYKIRTGRRNLPSF